MSLPNDPEKAGADDETDKNNVDAGGAPANEDDDNAEEQRSPTAGLSAIPAAPRSVSRASLKSAASLPSGSAADKAQRKGSAMSNVTVTSSSGLSFVSASGKKKKAKEADLMADGHKVTFTVTVAMALPSAADDDESKKNKRILAEPKALAHYHLEYFLLPTDSDPVKTDVTLYGIAAKVYPDKQEGKVLKTWHENGRTWVAWVHSHVIHVTTDLLKRLCYHKLVLRIWDTRTKFSPKAMYDKPRAFKLPPAKPGEDFDDISGVKTIILKQCRSFLKGLPKEVLYRDLPSLPELRPKARAEASRTLVDLPALPVDKAVSNRTTAVEKPVPCLLLAHPDMDYETHSKLLELAKLDTVIVDKHMLKANGIDINIPAEKSSGDGPSAGATGGASDELLNNAPAVKRQKGRAKSKAAKEAHKPIDRRAQQLAKEAAEYAKKYGVCSIHIPFGPLFIGQRQVSARLECPVRSVMDAFAAVSIDKEVLSEEQRKELNPMSIKVLSVKGMPDTPLSYEELDRRCHPVHVRYDFYKHSTYRTPDKPHTATVYWNDVNVILLGLIPHAELRQYLAGPPLLVQLHDRDRIIQKEVATPALFGKEAEDEKISNVGLVSGHRTEFNALSGRPLPWDPYGIAHIALSDLLLGQKILRITAPVFNCPLPDMLGRQAEGAPAPGATDSIFGVPGSVDGPTSAPLPIGQYVECHTTLKVRVEVSVPLTTPDDVALKPQVPQTEECPFGRLVYIFDYDSKQMVRDVLDLVTRINALALGLDSLSPMVLDAALSTYKLSAAQQKSRELDIVTGFQVLDGHCHIFVLEGLKDKAIKNMWETLPKPAASSSSRVTVLYNSDLAFSERLYGSLDVDLTRVKLHEPLGDIVRQPLLFVRDMVPKPCFKALIKLDELNRITTLRAAARNDLLPTAAMVISMSREFGVPLAPDDFVADDERKAVEDLLLDYRHAKEQAAAEVLPQESAHHSAHRMSLKDPLDDFNPKYVELLESRQKTAPTDFVGDNKNVVHATSAENRKRRKSRDGVRMTLAQAHNYSTQALNSTQLAIEKIRQDLNKDTLYTYNPEYHHSHTFVPVNVQHERKVEELASKAKWQSGAGWTYPGVKNLRQCNEHPRAPDTATKKELATEWTENALHSNKLQPTLPERERFTWIDRREDFDLWKVPPTLFNVEEPVTIMLAGAKLKEEKREAAKKAETQWRSKLVVDNIKPEFYRCNVQTEQIAAGRKASNELSRLQGLLRSEPRKHSYAARGFRVEIPPLNVAHNPSVDTHARELGLVDVGPAVPSATGGKRAGGGAFKPGPLAERSWLLEKNRIPAIEYDNAVEGYFNVYHNEAAQSKLHKRTIVPLTDGDYHTNLFALPPQFQHEQTS